MNAEGININERLRYSWTIDIPAEEVQDANDLVLRFIPFGGSCDGDEEVSSPRFSIEAAPASVPTSTSTDQSASTPASSLGTSTDFSKNPTASSGAPSTTTDTPAASATPETASPASAGLSTGAKAGIGVGVGLVTVLLLSALLLFLKVKKSREHAQSWYGERTNPEKEITSRHTDPYQDGPQQGSGWSATYKGSGLAKKPNGVPVEQPVQELDGRDMILEADGGRYDR